MRPRPGDREQLIERFSGQTLCVSANPRHGRGATSQHNNRSAAGTTVGYSLAVSVSPYQERTNQTHRSIKKTS
jgi:hypothetical protein